MNTKKRIAKALIEAAQKNVVMTSDKYKEIGDELDDETIVKIVDENDGDGEDYERVSREIEHGVNPEMGDVSEEEVPVEEPVNVPKLQADVQKFMDKLNLNQFKNVIVKIDKPIEKAELIAAFAERIGVPRAKLPVVLSALKALGADSAQQEGVRAKMRKSDLAEHIIKNKK